MTSIVFSNKEKERIAAMVLERQRISGMNQSQFARSISAGKADMSNLKGKYLDNPQLIGDDKWLRFARLVNFTRNEQAVWNTAETEVKQYIDIQLNICKNESETAILCDAAGIGKTHACKVFATSRPHVYYINCSDARSRSRLIRAVARSVGADPEGRLDDVFEDAMYLLSVTDHPLVIFDEAGDLEDTAFLELKRLFNNLEGQCGFYMIGADGLKKKIERAIANKKVGFTEVYSRYGNKFSRITPDNRNDRKTMFFAVATDIMKANGITGKQDIDRVLNALIADGLKDMRTVKREVNKLRRKVLIDG